MSSLNTNFFCSTTSPSILEESTKAVLLGVWISSMSAGTSQPECTAITSPTMMFSHNFSSKLSQPYLYTFALLLLARSSVFYRVLSSNSSLIIENNNTAKNVTNYIAGAFGDMLKKVRIVIIKK
jgi:hypothetical protein